VVIQSNAYMSESQPLAGSLVGDRSGLLRLAAAHLDGKGSGRSAGAAQLRQEHSRGKHADVGAVTLCAY
jgi:hypothetical protein